MTVWFTEDDLRAAAGDPSYQRGRDYVDAVTDVQPTAYGVRAAVRGSDPYEVWLGREGGGVAGECSCPYGAEGNFCKHCVAVGLVLLADGGHGGPGVDELESFLHTLSVSELADLLLTQAKRDPALYRRLALRSAGATGTPQVAVLRRQLDEALRVRTFQGAADYATRARDALDTISDLIESGHAAEARPLARGAVERLTDALSQVDDSSAVVAVCQRALRLYARACAAARPNPAKLAAWLFQLAKDGPGWPEVSPVDFAEALGDAGMAEYRALLHEAWREDPTDRVRQLRESLAAAEGDVDALVDVLSDSLPAVRSYQRIVEVLRKAGRLTEAVSWAERGAAETDNPALAELLIQSYLDNQQGDEAVEQRKAVLRTTPTRLTYHRLKETATEVKMWTAVREWALNVLTAAATKTDGTDLAGALLDDSEPAEAWQAAEKYGCTGTTRLEVIRSRAATHPADTLPAYRELIEDRIEQGGRSCYREAAILLTELRDAGPDEFDTYLAHLKQRHARRKALTNELTKAGLHDDPSGRP